MKLVQTGLLAASVLSLFLAVGCSQSPKTSMKETEPAIMTTATRKDIMAGESVMLMARTENLVGARDIKWSVSPNAAKIQAQGDTHGQTAYFSADQPGVYVVRASADAGNGQIVSSETTITVNGPGRTARE